MQKEELSIVTRFPHYTLYISLWSAPVTPAMASYGTWSNGSASSETLSGRVATLLSLLEIGRSDGSWEGLCPLSSPLAGSGSLNRQGPLIDRALFSRKMIIRWHLTCVWAIAHLPCGITGRRDQMRQGENWTHSRWAAAREAAEATAGSPVPREQRRAPKKCPGLSLMLVRSHCWTSGSAEVPTFAHWAS